MKYVPIANVCSVNPRVPSSLASKTDRDVDFIPMAGLGEDGRITVNGTRKLGEVLKGYTYFENGDVIVAKITPCLENGKAAYVNGLPHKVGFGSTEFHVLRSNSDVDPRYLFYMVWNPRFRHEASRNMTGTAGQQRVPTSFFERFVIPVPSLPQQKRIADILDKADAIRRKRQLAAGTTSSLRTSLFLSTFGEANKQSRSWPLVMLAAVVSRPITYGILKPGDDIAGGVPMLRIQDIRDGRVVTDDLHHVSRELSQQYKRTILTGGEIVVSLVGTIGLVAVVPGVLRGANVHRNLGVIVPSDRVRTSYLYHLMLSPLFKQSLSRTVKGGIQRLLNLGDLGRVEIRIPPLDLQEQFESQIEKHSVIACKGASLTEAADDLFKSLVQRAFRGELS